ncbi:uncharacterized protein H6S33_010786 [Morchella sextelata]|uniref:uncharacterized protein n=1 Tax=Morchella sextelata TaxID=1174677 RepID=UPI001D04E878|nr:uncharacterized protein H6S33_010786 [Morchella sextelata]KAH0611521.1 hypothetical protein H6S33_010786 [Morchella sextelata]
MSSNDDKKGYYMFCCDRLTVEFDISVWIEYGILRTTCTDRPAAGVTCRTPPPTPAPTATSPEWLWNAGKSTRNTVKMIFLILF